MKWLASEETGNWILDLQRSPHIFNNLAKSENCEYFFNFSFGVCFLIRFSCLRNFNMFCVFILCNADLVRVFTAKGDPCSCYNENYLEIVCTIKFEIVSL